MASNKLKTYIGYNPTNVEGFSTKEKRAAFSKLRAIANKRLEKMERYDYKQNQYYKDLTNMFKSSRVPTLDAISDKKLDKALSEVSYFLRGLTTIQKIHAYENKQIKITFDKINKELGVTIEHYIISSGMEEIISGTSIRKHFKDVFGCSYVYDEEKYDLSMYNKADIYFSEESARLAVMKKEQEND